MTGPAPRTPTHYLHGVEGAVVVIPARVAAYLHQHLELDRLRKEVRGADAEVDNVLVAMSVAHQYWRASAYGTAPRNTPERKPQSAWLTATQAADLLDQTSRAVRMACANGRLRAERVGGQWQISREDFEHYRAAHQG